MQELEKLLNSLMQRGWKPWGIKHFVEVLVSGTTATFFTEKSVASHASLRSLVSLESGLWQFCVENELTRGYNGDEWKYTEIFPGDYRDYPADEHKYRLLESALIPEKELGKFLVENIKLEGNSK